MIVLDTNVLSELMRPKRDDRVTRWLDEQPVSSLFSTTITQAEIEYGLALLPSGRRQTSLREAARRIFNVDLAERILPFDNEAAEAYAQIATTRRRSGKPISVTDAQIAAIVRSRGARLATRNVSDFDGCGIELVNPWTDA